MCSCLWFCLHSVESAFGFIFEHVLTTDYGTLYCTERVNDGKKGEGAGRIGSDTQRKWTCCLLPSSPQMNLLCCLMTCCLEPLLLLFAFLSPPWLEWLCGNQDQSLSSFFLAVAFIRSFCIHTHSALPVCQLKGVMGYRQFYLILVKPVSWHNLSQSS